MDQSDRKLPSGGRDTEKRRKGRPLSNSHVSITMKLTKGPMHTMNSNQSLDFLG